LPTAEVQEYQFFNESALSSHVCLTLTTFHFICFWPTCCCCYCFRFETNNGHKELEFY